MNIKGKKEVNEDFIPVVYLNGSNLEYIEIDIDKKIRISYITYKKSIKRRQSFVDRDTKYIFLYLYRKAKRI